MMAVFCAMIIPVLAQTIDPSPRRMEYVKGGERVYGFVKADGTVVTKPVYAYAHEFSEGLAVVLDSRGRWGCVDTTGKRIFSFPSTLSHDPSMFVVGNFSEGLCWFRDSITEKVGFVDKKGAVVVKPQWDFAHDFQCGLAAVGRGRIWMSNFFEWFGLTGYIDHSGKVVVDLNLGNGQYDENIDFSDNMAVITKGNHVMIIDTKGNNVALKEYRQAMHFSEGLCAVAVATNEPCEGHDCELRWGFIDANGQMVIKPTYRYGGMFREGLCAIMVGKSYVFIDRAGRNVMGRQFENARPFYEGLAYVEEKDGTVGYINHKGEMVLRLKDGFHGMDFKCGLVEVGKGEKRGKYTDWTERLIDRKGKVVWEYEYTSWFD